MSQSDLILKLMMRFRFSQGYFEYHLNALKMSRKNRLLRQAMNQDTEQVNDGDF